MRSSHHFKAFAFMSLLFATSLVQAQTKTSIIPTSYELEQYRSEMSVINSEAANCLNETWNTHINFYNQYKVSKFYGDRHADWMDRRKRLKVIREVGAPAFIVDQQEPISCIGLTMRCLNQAFYKTQNSAVIGLWNKINNHVKANGTQGDYLIRNLQNLGWKVLYWNPDPSQNISWDKEDVQILKANKVVTWDSFVKNDLGQNVFNSGWGYHDYRYKFAMKRNDYAGLRIDDKKTLVGFGTNVPQEFKQSPFFVGIAHAGYHVFSGAFGQVIEAHSMRHLSSIHNLEMADFNPLAGLAPQWTQSEKYRSGVIAVPPVN